MKEKMFGVKNAPVKQMWFFYALALIPISVFKNALYYIAKRRNMDNIRWLEFIWI